jgi:hypothetical protein
MKESVRATMSRRINRRLIFGLLAGWFSISLYSAVLLPDFWSAGRCLWSIFLAYPCYYAWSRISRGSGQAGVAFIAPDSPMYAKVMADLAMFWCGTLCTLVLVGRDDALSWAFP